MAHSITTVKARAALKPRTSPYWHRIAKGCHLGYRKTSATAPGTWVAKFRNDDDDELQHSLGGFDGIPPSEHFDAARKKAADDADAANATTKRLTIANAGDPAYLKAKWTEAMADPRVKAAYTASMAAAGASGASNKLHNEQYAQLVEVGKRAGQVRGHAGRSNEHCATALFGILHIRFGGFRGAVG